MKKPSLPCAACGTLLLDTANRCAFCAAPLRLTDRGFVIDGVPPIETRVELERRTRAIAEATRG